MIKTKIISACIAGAMVFSPVAYAEAQTLTRDNVDQVAPRFVEALQAMNGALLGLKLREQQEGMILSHIGRELPILAAQVAYLSSANLVSEDVALQTVSMQAENYSREINNIVTERNARQSVLDTIAETLRGIGEIFAEIA